MTPNKSSERGQALVIIVVAMIVLVGMTALAIDGGNAYSDRRHAQNAADTAVLAAALSKVNDQDWNASGLDRASSNGYTNDGTNTVNVYQCDNASATCNLAASEPPAEYVQVVIVSHVRTYFARALGFQEFVNRVNAVAHAKPSTTKQMFSGNAVVGLDPHDCKAVTYQGNADTNLSGGGIYVNSDCSNSAFFNNSGSASLTAPSLCSVGGITYAPGALNIPPTDITIGCTPEPLPEEPNPSCTGSASYSGDTMNPGTWTGAFPPAGVTKLNAGIYCVSGNFQLNGGDSLTSLGSGVVIRMNSGNVTWNGNAIIHLSAPSSGPFQGLLLYMPSSNNGTITINGTSDSTIIGTIMGFSADVTVDGTGGAVVNGQIVGYTVDLTGTSANSISYDDQLNFNAYYAPQIELNK